MFLRLVTKCNSNMRVLQTQLRQPLIRRELELITKYRTSLTKTLVHLQHRPLIAAKAAPVWLRDSLDSISIDTAPTLKITPRGLNCYLVLAAFCWVTHILRVEHIKRDIVVNCRIISASQSQPSRCYEGYSRALAHSEPHPPGSSRAPSTSQPGPTASS